MPKTLQSRQLFKNKAMSNLKKMLLAICVVSLGIVYIAKADVVCVYDDIHLENNINRCTHIDTGVDICVSNMHEGPFCATTIIIE